MYFDSVITGPIGVNTYLIGAEDTEKCIVIDPGDAAPVIDALHRAERTCTQILITHGHFDHIMGVAAMSKATGAPIAVHEADAECLYSNRKSLSFMMGLELLPVHAERVLRDNEIVTAAGLQLRVLHTPGHSVGSVSYVVDSEQTVFVGDTLFFESVGRTDFPGGSNEVLCHSIVERLFSLGASYRVFPGHGESTTIAHEKECNPFVLGGRQFSW